MSIVGAHVGERRVILWGDSREIDAHGWCSDGHTKLFQAGDRSAVGITGATFSGYGADTYIPLMAAGICSDKRFADQPHDLLCAIRDAVHPPLAAWVARSPELFQWLKVETSLIFGAFCIRRSQFGTITLIELRIPLLSRNGIPVVGEPILKPHLNEGSFSGAYFQGGTGCDLAGNRDAINPDRPDQDVVAEVDRLAGIFSGRTIGGPIDIAAIDSTGFRWIRQKPFVGALVVAKSFDSVDDAIAKLTTEVVEPLRRDVANEQCPVHSRTLGNALIDFIDGGSLRAELEIRSDQDRGGAIELLLPREMIERLTEEAKRTERSLDLSITLAVLMGLAGAAKLRTQHQTAGSPTPH